MVERDNCRSEREGEMVEMGREREESVLSRLQPAEEEMTDCDETGKNRCCGGCQNSSYISKQHRKICRRAQNGETEIYESNSRNSHELSRNVTVQHSAIRGSGHRSGQWSSGVLIATVILLSCVSCVLSSSSSSSSNLVTEFKDPRQGRREDDLFSQFVSHPTYFLCLNVSFTRSLLHCLSTAFLSLF